jgi:hypothetical protein
MQDRFSRSILSGVAEMDFAWSLIAGIFGLMVADHLGASMRSGPNRIGAKQYLVLCACLAFVMAGLGLLVSGDEVLGTTIFLGGVTFAYNETAKARVWFGTWCGFRGHQKRLKRSARAVEDTEAIHGADSPEHRNAKAEYFKSRETRVVCAS